MKTEQPLWGRGQMVSASPKIPVERFYDRRTAHSVSERRGVLGLAVC
jgi:hypothetical protein